MTNYNGLQGFIRKLEDSDEIIRIAEEVSPKLEITEIADRISKQPNGGKALLFENNGTNFPVLINAFGSESRIQKALQIDDVHELSARIDDLFTILTQDRESLLDKLKVLPKLALLGSFMPKKNKGKGKCQEVEMSVPDMNQLPVLTCWPFDGGPFVTLPVVHTTDPNNGISNIGMYRMQVFDKNKTGMHWHKHKVGARHYNEYKKLNKKMPVTVTLGGDPVYTYCATAPMPDNIDEYILAGFLRKKKVRMVKCLTNDLYVPEDVDIVIEGYVDPNEDFVTEGPFGDHTGFYSLADLYPVFHITCITYRKDAVYPATIVGIPPMEDAQLGRITERLFFSPIKFSMIPELTNMHLPTFGVAHNLVIASAKVSYEGQAFKIANAMWGAGQMMFTKYIVIVDEDVDIFDYNLVMTKILENVRGEQDVLFSKGPMDVLEHSTSKFAVGGKICIDATSEKLNSNEILSENSGLKNYLPDGIRHKELFENVYALYGNIEMLHFKIDQIQAETAGNGIIIFVEPELEKVSKYTLAWYILGNTDPERDVKIKGKVLIVDGTRKNNREDFKRMWPDLTVMNDETIEKVNAKWDKYGLGMFVESPSKQFKEIALEEGAHL